MMGMPVSFFQLNGQLLIRITYDSTGFASSSAPITVVRRRVDHRLFIMMFITLATVDHDEATDCSDDSRE